MKNFPKLPKAAARESSHPHIKRMKGGGLGKTAYGVSPMAFPATEGSTPMSSPQPAFGAGDTAPMASPMPGPDPAQEGQ